jgi:hypothetical protein
MHMVPVPLAAACDAGQYTDYLVAIIDESALSLTEFLGSKDNDCH